MSSFPLFPSRLLGHGQRLWIREIYYLIDEYRWHRRFSFVKETPHFISNLWYLISYISHGQFYGTITFSSHSNREQTVFRRNGTMTRDLLPGFLTLFFSLFGRSLLYYFVIRKSCSTLVEGTMSPLEITVREKFVQNDEWRISTIKIQEVILLFRFNDTGKVISVIYE